MSRTRVFLSSTCYDLKALREHLREKIEGMGHELLASEYSSFPVSPGLSTVENCKKVVRDHADLLVLVVGGRRGSLDASGARSVVNAEYLEARAKGIDCFVFVDRQVWDLVPIYQKNREADFSAVVDHPDVFKLVEELKSESRWIYPFSKTEDIIVTLQTQFSVFLRMLIERGRAGSLVIPRAFATEPAKVLSLIQERPPFWEHLLTSELIDSAIASARRRLDDLNKGIVIRPCDLLSQAAAFDRIQQLFGDITNIAKAFEPAVQAIMPAWGPPGVAGDPIEIRHVCCNISALLDALIDWETRLRFVEPPYEFRPLFKSLEGSTVEFIQEIERIPKEIRQVLEAVKANPQTTQFRIDLTIRSPSTLARFNEELAKLRRNLRH